MLYLIEILHQTTTLEMSSRFCSGCILSKFYIKPQRGPIHPWTRSRCILSKFYIKPQPRAAIHQAPIVVSYRNSTSNHNREIFFCFHVSVVSYRNSTSNHNIHTKRIAHITVVSYRNSTSNHNGQRHTVVEGEVVSYRNSTSNHNTNLKRPAAPAVVSYRNSTSNHNDESKLDEEEKVVSYRNSTSNHNNGETVERLRELYLIEILHQTTTDRLNKKILFRCILSKFYIKPQRRASY